MAAGIKWRQCVVVGMCLDLRTVEAAHVLSLGEGRLKIFLRKVTKWKQTHEYTGETYSCQREGCGLDEKGEGIKQRKNKRDSLTQTTTVW